MRMNSDLGKLKRRNYMVKAQLKSLESKSRAINEKINSDSNVDEWAESYIARADAQIDDVADYMEFRNLQNLSGIFDRDYFEPVTIGSSLSPTMIAALAGGAVGAITYNRTVIPEGLTGPRARRAAVFAAVSGLAAASFMGVLWTHQNVGFTPGQTMSIARERYNTNEA